jgi:hypothetical protein
MSETSSETTTKSKRSSTKSASTAATSYEEALEQGYFGGPADDTDYTVAGVIAAPDITETSVTHELVPAKAAELQDAVATAYDPNKATSA